MRLSKLAGLAAASCVASAGVQAAWGLKYEVSPNGVSWGPAIGVNPGGTIYFRMGVYFDPGTQVTTSGGVGNAVVFARFNGQQKITNTLAGQDQVSDLVRLVPGAGVSFLSTTSNASSILIGTNLATSFASNVMSNVDSYIEVPEPYMPIFKGKLTLSPDPAQRTLTLMNNLFGASGNPGLRFYNDVPLSPIESGAPVDSPNHTDLNATIHVSSSSCASPTIHSVSGPATVAPSQTATFTVNASNAAFYEWLKNGSTITQTGHFLGTGTATMTLTYPTSFDAASYRVRVYGFCGTPTLSNPITLSVICAADLTRDGFVNDSDFVIFTQSYEKLFCGGSIPCEADFNLDGFVDDLDFVIFVSQYDQLICP